jgi:RNA polymerase sigma factor (TIGR02999 family)
MGHAGNPGQRYTRGPMSEDHGELTGLLRLHREGDRDAFDRLVQQVYPYLKRIAGRQLRGGRPGDTLNTTALVNEAYLKLVDHRERTWENRAHFFAVTARAMRQIIVDYARRKLRKKRGGGEVVVPLEEDQVPVEHEAEQLLAIDTALQRLERDQPRLAQVVECRYFAGLTIDETAQALGISPRTVERDWQEAKALLQRELG